MSKVKSREAPVGRMEKDGRSGEPRNGMGNNRSDRLRTRAAWMYFVEQMTQNQIADALGIGRVSVVRMLAEARSRGEVKISIEGELAEITELERALER